MCHPVFDGRNECLDFAVVAFNDAFNASVGTVTDAARDVKSAGDVIGGEPEAHSLHVSDKSDDSLFYGHCTRPQGSTRIAMDGV